MSDTNGSPDYKVVISAYVAKQAQKLHDIAVDHDLGKAFIEALEVIDHGLRTNPREFGGPLFRLPALKLQIFMRGVFPVAVDYGVHDKLPLVIVRGFRLMI
jgi:hypothetical protein